jgi:hypothetical protein
MDNRDAIAPERAAIPRDHPVMSGWLSPRAREMSDRTDLAWARSMALLRPISPVLKSELPLCGARCRDGHACRAKAAWDGIRPYNGRCRLHGGLSTGPRTQEGRDRLSAATKKMWTEHREERRANISAGVRRYWDAVRQCALTISIISHICARVAGSHPDILINAGRKQGTNYQGAAMSYYYRTPEHRARQSAAIQQWRPWEHSTGPKSEEGKARVSRNAYKGRTRAARLRNLWRVLRIP